jgi:thioredoxin-dependent peroxiredoxin
VLEEGTQAPDFTLPDQNRAAVTLSDLRGGTVVLYFYPRADTPGCTIQACGVRDHAGDYEAAGATVIGISPDPQSAVARFAEKHTLRFPLLADEDHTVADAYGVWGEKHMYGKTYWGTSRSTFIIGRDGRIAKVLAKVSPKTHDDEVLDLLAEGRRPRTREH